jgi:hypothetical protein
VFAYADANLDVSWQVKLFCNVLVHLGSQTVDCVFPSFLSSGFDKVINEL